MKKIFLDEEMKKFGFEKNQIDLVTEIIGDCVIEVLSSTKEKKISFEIRKVGAINLQISEKKKRLTFIKSQNIYKKVKYEKSIQK